MLTIYGPQPLFRTLGASDIDASGNVGVLKRQSVQLTPSCGVLLEKRVLYFMILGAKTLLFGKKTEIYKK